MQDGAVSLMLPGVASTRSTPKTTVVCADCGVDYLLGRCTALEHERQGVPNRCTHCRHPRRTDAAQVEAAKAWWLERFTLAEIRSWPRL
jgi:DNA-directed RNA polymerase subunit RPC12/RpoP